MIRKCLRWTSCFAFAVFGANCESTLPTADSLDQYEIVLRQQAAPEFQALDRRYAAGEISAEDYQLEKKRLEHRIRDDARDAAWSRHSLAQSERKSMGIPTPDFPVSITAPNAMTGGVSTMGVGHNSGTAGTLYRPFTENARGGGDIMRGSSIPTFNSTNNAGSRYVQ